MNTRGCIQLVLVAICSTFVSCDPLPDSSVSPPETVSVLDEYLNLPDRAFRYGQNTPDQMILLGRVLFYDKSLSANNSISCASCHKQRYAFGDNVALSKGLNGELTTRNSMPLMDTHAGGMIKTSLDGPVFPGGLFWDGRSVDLHEAVGQPIINHIEMGMPNMVAVLTKLRKIPYYQELFTKIFGSVNTVQTQDIQESLAFFVRAMQSESTRFQKHENGSIQLTSSELMGKQLFAEKYDCGSCHESQLGVHTNQPLTYGTSFIGFANIGLPADDDKGLFEFNPKAEHTGLFKIPNLNNVALTAPYMHDGSLATLEDVLDHYSESIQDDPNLDVRLRNADKSPMRMKISAQEKKAIIDFLKTFTDERMATAAEFSNPFRRRN